MENAVEALHEDSESTSWQELRYAYFVKSQHHVINVGYH